jgi:hypothetical protein
MRKEPHKMTTDIVMRFLEKFAPNEQYEILSSYSLLGLYILLIAKKKLHILVSDIATS